MQEGLEENSTNEALVVEEVSVVEETPTKPEPIPVKLITDPQERMDAMYELQLINNLINTYYFLPKLDKGNGNTQQQKITSSVQLNYFGSVQLNEWGAKIIELSARLGLNGEYKNGKAN